MIDFTPREETVNNSTMSAEDREYPAGLRIALDEPEERHPELAPTWLERIRVYVAGPYTGNPVGGTRAAVHMGRLLWELGFAPYVPHTTMLWDLIEPGEPEFYMALDFQWLSTCHAILRLPGRSSGADREVEFCKLHGIPVFDRVHDLVAWADTLSDTWVEEQDGEAWQAAALEAVARVIELREEVGDLMRKWAGEMARRRKDLADHDAYRRHVEATVELLTSRLKPVVSTGVSA